MSTQNIGFYEDFSKLSSSYHKKSSNTYLISSSAGIRLVLTFSVIEVC